MGQTETGQTIEVRLFGPEAAAAGCGSVTVRIDESATPADVLRAVESACPALWGQLNHCRVAVEHEFAGPATRIGAGDEVAIIGLVSGG